MKNRTLEDSLVHEVWRQDIRAIKKLLELGANPNATGRTWASAILCAGENDKTGEIASLLVSAGANINMQDQYGQTPLHFAVDVAIDGATQQNLPQIDWRAVGVFLDLGADPTIRDDRGKTAMDFVFGSGEYAKKSFDEFMNARRI